MVVCFQNKLESDGTCIVPKAHEKPEIYDHKDEKDALDLINDEMKDEIIDALELLDMLALQEEY